MDRVTGATTSSGGICLRPADTRSPTPFAARSQRIKSTATGCLSLHVCQGPGAARMTYMLTRIVIPCRLLILPASIHVV